MNERYSKMIPRRIAGTLAAVAAVSYTHLGEPADFFRAFRCYRLSLAISGGGHRFTKARQRADDAAHEEPGDQRHRGQGDSLSLIHI